MYQSKLLSGKKLIFETRFIWQTLFSKIKEDYTIHLLHNPYQAEQTGGNLQKVERQSPIMFWIKLLKHRGE